MFFINNVLEFKYQPGNLKVNIISVYSVVWRWRLMLSYP